MECMQRSDVIKRHNSRTKLTTRTYNGAGGHVVHEATEEGLGGEVSVVLLEELTGGLLGSEKQRRIEDCQYTTSCNMTHCTERKNSKGARGKRNVGENQKKAGVAIER